ncbi:MAG: serine protease [Smithellaceae bacterium]
MKKTLLALLILVLVQSAPADLHLRACAGEPDSEDVAIPAPSTAAQKLYLAAREDLLQVRVLLKNGRSQVSVGSGFLIGRTHWVITNYHVVSQVALEPETYVAEFVDTHGERGPVALMAVDALRDLALVRISRKGGGFFTVPEKPPDLKQGQYLYSLGNPLDLGFAISEGAYNGIIKRGFYEQLMFTGPINAGMSGGPSVTVDGRLAGVNVSKRLDGELVSFLIPVSYVKELLKSVSDGNQPPADFKDVVGGQLLVYQAVMVDRLMGAPLGLKEMGPYRVPVRESDQMRCWGRSDTRPDKTYAQDHMTCSMESSLYVSDQLRTGWMSMHHTFRRSTQLGALRFATMAGSAFKGQIFGYHKDRNLTGNVCAEQFVHNGHLSMRAVICVRAYRKFSGLYDFTALAVSTDESLMNLQSRLDIKGVSYENGMKVSRLFLESIRREEKP